MEKPPYELEALKNGVKKCDENIERFQEAIKKEEELKTEMKFYIKQHEHYNRLHGIPDN